MDPLTTVAVIVGAASVVGVGLWLHGRSNRRQAQTRLAGRPQRDPTSFGQAYFADPEAGLAAEVRHLLANHVPFPLDGLAPDDALVQDLRMDELDSLSTVDFLLAVEDHFEIKVADADARVMRTFRDLVEYLARQGVQPRGIQRHEVG